MKRRTPQKIKITAGVISILLFETLTVRARGRCLASWRWTTGHRVRQHRIEQHLDCGLQISRNERSELKIVIGALLYIRLAISGKYDAAIGDAIDKVNTSLCDCKAERYAPTFR